MFSMISRCLKLRSFLLLQCTKNVLFILLHICYLIMGHWVILCQLAQNPELFPPHTMDFETVHGETLFINLIVLNIYMYFYNLNIYKRFLIISWVCFTHAEYTMSKSSAIDVWKYDLKKCFVMFCYVMFRLWLLKYSAT